MTGQMVKLPEDEDTPEKVSVQATGPALAASMASNELCGTDQIEYGRWEPITDPRGSVPPLFDTTASGQDLPHDGPRQERSA